MTSYRAVVLALALQATGVCAFAPHHHTQLRLRPFTGATLEKEKSAASDAADRGVNRLAYLNERGPAKDGKKQAGDKTEGQGAVEVEVVAASAATAPEQPPEVKAAVAEVEGLLEAVVEEAAAAKSAATLSPKEEKARERKRDKLKRLLLKDKQKELSSASELSFGEQLEAGWARRGSGSSLRRNIEVWKFGLQAVLKVLKANKVDGAAEPAARAAAATQAATFIRDGLVRLGPTFVKLGQVVSTRTDLFSDAYISVLKTLQDDVPAFSGDRAAQIVAAELGVSDVGAVLQDFSKAPIAAASLGQVHTALYKGTKVAVKVQRAGLKELFDVDLKNLKKLAALLDKFDPKSDGADRDWVSIYDESARLLYLEIDYLNEAKNTERFREQFKGTDWVRTPQVYEALSTPRVLVMEYVESLKLTDIAQIDRLALDKELLAKRTAESFLSQVLRTGYFHCDPHPGNLAVDKQGNLVYYDYGMMDELGPTVREGFRNLCFALFEGGPFISDLQLSKQARQFKLALEQMGVLAKGADTLAVEKFGRFCIKTFKEVQRGGSPTNIKTEIGPDLQALTEAQVFRFPSTFTFIFRAFASIDGIGKGLDPKFDIALLAQPFIEAFTNEVKYGQGASGLDKFVNVAGKATGLNLKDVETAVTQPRKVAYLEETVRAMEQGTLKIRVRSLENERALERMALTQARTSALLAASVLLQLALSPVVAPLPSFLAGCGAAVSAAQVLGAAAKTAAFDKKAAKYEQKDFE